MRALTPSQSPSPPLAPFPLSHALRSARASDKRAVALAPARSESGEGELRFPNFSVRQDGSSRGTVQAPARYAGRRPAGRAPQAGISRLGCTQQSPDAQDFG